MNDARPRVSCWQMPGKAKSGQLVAFQVRDKAGIVRKLPRDYVFLSSAMSSWRREENKLFYSSWSIFSFPSLSFSLSLSRELKNEGRPPVPRLAKFPAQSGKCFGSEPIVC